jgi:hypothetical protein
VEAYAKGGGRVLLTGASGIDVQKGCVFDLGAAWEGESQNKQGDYLLPNPELRASFVNDPLFMYAPSQRIRVTNGASLGAIYDPYFDRAANHFSGHVNTPSKPDPSGYDAGVQKGNFVYLAHPIFTAYKRVGAVAMLEIAHKVIGHALVRRRMIETSLPLAGRATLRQQPAAKRDVLHLLYATPVLRGSIRGDNVQPIQDLITLHDIDVSIETAGHVKSVETVPSGEVLLFAQQNGRAAFQVTELRGHQIVEISY